jgi:hypothetical protein
MTQDSTAGHGPIGASRAEGTPNASSEPEPAASDAAAAEATAVVEPTSPRIERLEIDGIPVFWMPDGRRPMAALQFRVGRSDETFATMGVTHLVEHLAFFKLGQRDHTNGFVDNIRTVFTIHGDGSEIVEFMAAICDAIHALPLGRLSDEARILRAEALRRAPSIFDELAWLRFGAAGHGLAHIPEFGLSRLAPGDVTAWAAARFTAGNAAMWIAGPMPEALRLPLPAGPRRPVTVTDPIPGLHLPAAAASRIPGVALGAVIPREWPFTIGTRVLTKRLEQRLRYEMGRSYEVSLAYGPLDGTVGHASIFASCLDSDALDVRTALLEATDQFADRGPTADELADDRAAYARYRDDPDSGYGLLDRAVHQELLGIPRRSAEEELAEHQAVTPEDVREAFAKTLDEALLAGPLGAPPVGLSGRQWSAYPIWSEQVVTGRTFDRTTKRFPWSRTTEELIVGPDGVSWLDGTGNVRTVRYDDCVGLLIDQDGARVVNGRDGFRVVVRASEWKRGDAAVAAVDRAIPEALVIRLPPA